MKNSTKTKNSADDPQPFHLTDKLHIDKRAGAVIAATDEEGSDADLLTTAQVAIWLGVSTQWLEIGRGKNYGPEFVRLAPQMIRYRRSVVIDWLKQREHAHTSEYLGRGGRAKKLA